jgi:hypothetical protein
MTAGTRTAVLGLSLVVFLTTGAPLGAQNLHKRCGKQEHPCANVVRVTECCCQNGDASTQPGLTETRVGVAADHSTLVSVVVGLEPPTLPKLSRSGNVDTSPPLARSLNLPILFADLRL